MESRTWQLLIIAGITMNPAWGSPSPEYIDFWYGTSQVAGKLGTLQDDFNILGHIRNWQQVDQLEWALNERSANPLHFRAFRRLVDDGDFNADIPMSWMNPGSNKVTITATLKDGTEVVRSLEIIRKNGSSNLPYSIRWDSVKNLQDVGQVVDGKWEVTDQGLRTRQIGYDRLFLIGEKHWKDYEILTSITIHAVPDETTPLSGGNALGIIWRFTGHVVGGFRDFPAAQPKWGYQPFGAIGWLRWPNKGKGSPFLQFYRGYSDHPVNFGRFAYSLEVPYAIRMQCRTLPDAEDGSGVTEYRYKIWKKTQQEPDEWAWTHKQTNANALRSGGLALVAHHVDATFGDIDVWEINATESR